MTTNDPPRIPPEIQNRLTALFDTLSDCAKRSYGESSPQALLRFIREKNLRCSPHPVQDLRAWAEDHNVLTEQRSRYLEGGVIGGDALFDLLVRELESTQSSVWTQIGITLLGLSVLTVGSVLFFGGTTADGR